MTAPISQQLLGRVRLLRGMAYVARRARGWLVNWPRRMKIRADNVRYLGRRAPDGLPIPPPSLMHLVAGSRRISWFLQSGKLGADSIRRILKDNGVDIRKLRSILDFGCGCGRVIRHWEDLTPETAVHGTDYNRKLVEWCRRKLEFAHFESNCIEPPLAYEGETFDLIYALSVFTHLSEDFHFAWIDELSRVLKPNGHLLISTRTSIDPGKLHQDERQAFSAGRLVVRSAGLSGSNFSNAFHPESFVRERLAADFEVIDFVVEGARGNPPQDVFLLKKPVSESSRDSPPG